MKKWIWIITISIILSMLFFYLKSNNTPENAKSFMTAPVTRGNLRLTVAATGTITPYTEVELKSKASGEIISFPFQEGDILSKGKVAVRLDPETEKSRVNQANANLLIAEAKLEKAKITLQDEELSLKRQKSLFEDKVISRQDLDNRTFAVGRAVSDVKIAKAELIRAKVTLQESQDRLTDTEIRAPLNGTILKKYVEEGQVIASTTSSASEGTLLFIMADLAKIYIEAMVDETDIGKIIPGQSVTISVDAHRGKTFNGQVIRIAPKGRIESTITVFDVIVEVNDKDKKMLKPMMTANAEILIDRKVNVLLIPSEAVRQMKNKTGVYKASNSEAIWVPVSTGSNDGILTEIEGNISEGEEVIVSSIDNSMKSPGNSKNLRRGFRMLRRKK
jgi:HlyD family secretion protein